MTASTKIILIPVAVLSAGLLTPLIQERNENARLRAQVAGLQQRLQASMAADQKGRQALLAQLQALRNDLSAVKLENAALKAQFTYPAKDGFEKLPTADLHRPRNW